MKSDRHSSFAHTATGQLGIQRNSMLENELHQRAPLARSVTHCHDVPDNFVHGMKTHRAGGVSETMSWPESYNSLLNRSQYNSAPRDFISLNREAIRCGLHNSRELADFRATHDIRKKPEAEITAMQRSRTGIHLTRRIPAELIHGISTRPSTPIQDLLSGKFRDEWIQKQMNMKQESDFTVRRSKTMSHNNPGDTRTTLLRTHVVPIEDDGKGRTLWKLEKFERNAQAKVFPFQSPLCRDAAIRNARLSGPIGFRT